MHIITGLNRGGAEHSLLKLIKHDKINQHKVISLTGNGPLYKDFIMAGVPLILLDFKNSPLQALITLFKSLKEETPQVIQTWMYHADFIGGVVGKLLRIPVIWNVRHSIHDRNAERLGLKIIIYVNSMLSHLIPKSIVYCAHKSRHDHERIRYSNNNANVIHNGFYKAKFINYIQPLQKHDKRKRRLVNFCMVARYHPQKGHEVLLKAIYKIKKITSLSIECTLVGSGCNKSNRSLLALIKKYELENEIILADEHSDTEHFYRNSLFSVLPSLYGEGLPNAVGESLSVGTPVIATNVGDTKILIGECGLVVEPGDINGFVDAIILMSSIASDEMEYKRLRLASYKRIQVSYSMNNMASNYRKVWVDAIN